MHTVEIRLLALAYALLSFGGLLLHLRIHPVDAALLNWVPAVVGALNCVVVPFLFLRRALVAWGFLLAVFTVIAGAVGMAYFSLHTGTGPVTLSAIFFTSTFPDILVLLTKLPLALAIVYLARPKGPVESQRGCAS
ncbi:hypothetical protein [Oceanidesulfovibrio marinus]|uniref:Energy-coupling factor transport system substrate-specific component n=1 Tax=Oceanidesulfovibrio marinus TaxID=370038 RepID=A0ABX6NAC3_9BACT|nr:hypothetical protein [Oceanidesulfovibrio marinus]QJT07533.1 hypothetical protein E8L03_00750 [Oceanidesulfovibrio marinus]